MSVAQMCTYELVTQACFWSELQDVSAFRVQFPHMRFTLRLDKMHPEVTPKAQQL